MDITHFIGIDPGLKGGIAVVSGNECHLYDMPTEKDGKKTKIDGVSVRDILMNWLWDEPEKAWVMLEQVHSMPKQGVASTFSFGRGYGSVESAVEAFYIKPERVTPQTWKKHFDLIGQPKEAAHAYATEYFKDHVMFGEMTTPRGRKKDGVADALLIAEYARYKYNLTQLPEGKESHD